MTVRHPYRVEPWKSMRAGTANLDGDFVVLLIGMRINQVRRVDEWVPVTRAAFAMIRELERMPDSPLLQSRTVRDVGDLRTPFFVQHWRSLDALEAWANDRELLHRPAQREFFRRTAYNGHVGIWHEAYAVRAGEFEAIYANMPRAGLAAAGTYRDLRPTSTLHDRVGDPHAH